MFNMTQLKEAVIAKPEGTETVQIHDDETYFLRQCEESGVFLYWNNIEWTTTNLSPGELLIPIDLVEMIVDQELTISALVRRLK